MLGGERPSEFRERTHFARSPVEKAVKIRAKIFRENIRDKMTLVGE